LLEIEIKAYCGNLDDVRKGLTSLGAELIRSEREEDLYLGHPSRNFAATDEAFRLRLAGGKCLMTYKGPKIGTVSKARYERETPVAEFDAMRDILGRLGFSEVASVRKGRDIYLLNDIEICLDRVEGLGDFVEIERRGDEQEKIEKELFELAGKLGLERFERRSYLELLMLKKA
jgi:adenylate cyclase, class 2